jgi:hypothetical protein
MGFSNIGLSLATTLAATSSAARSIMAVKNDQKKGVLGDLKGFRSEKPLPANLYVAWTPGERRGSWGSFLNPWRIF